MDIDDIRRQINLVDDELLTLFLKRMELAKQVAEYKLCHDLPILHPEREREIIERAKAAAGNDMSDFAAKFFASVMELSKEYQHDLYGRS